MGSKIKLSIIHTTKYFYEAFPVLFRDYQSEDGIRRRRQTAREFIAKLS